MPNYSQKSYIRKYGNRDNFMEVNIVEDIRSLFQQLSTISLDEQVLGSSIWANGFRIVGCIGQDIILPANTNVEFTGPLSMCVGSTLTVPVGTTLDIV